MLAFHWGGPSPACLGRTLLSAVFDFNLALLQHPASIFVAGMVGQECPTHTGNPLSGALLDPQPTIVFWFFHQSSSYWILADVLQLFFQAAVGAKHVVKGLLLPD